MHECLPSNVANMHLNMKKTEYEQWNFCHYNKYSGSKIANLSTVYVKFELASAEGKPREARAPRHPTRALQLLWRQSTLQRAVMQG